jgi:type VI secretion system VasD/TssJ family lipoprotein
MKKYFTFPMFSLACLSLTGCCVFTDNIAVDQAESFVSAAFNKSMAEVNKIKMRPSKVAFSFYADKDVNSVIKKRRPVRNTKSPRQPKGLDQKKTTTQNKTVQNKTTLVTYNLKCEHSRSVTFNNCQLLNLDTLTKNESITRLNFKQIQLRKDNRLNILMQEPSSETGITSEYNLQCSREDPEMYHNCRHLSGKTSFTIKQVKMSIGANQFEVMVHQLITVKPQGKSETVVYDSIAPAPQDEYEEKSKWVDSYVDPKPISFKIVMLRDDSLLLSADKESLDSDIEEALKKNYIDHEDYVLTPGEFKFIRFTEIDEDTRYIGIIADYRDSQHSVWKAAYKVEATGSKYPLHIHLKRNEVDILSEDEGE